MTPYIGTICAFAFPKSPKGWLPCDGRLLPVAQNNALFTLLGFTYGGSGALFALPDLRGRAIVSSNDATMLNPGQSWGAPSITLTPDQLPPHRHVMLASDELATSANPSGLTYAKLNDGGLGSEITCYGPPNPENLPLPMAPTGSAGEGQPLSTQTPFLGINYCIAISGLFPAQAAQV